MNMCVQIQYVLFKTKHTFPLFQNVLVSCCIPRTQELAELMHLEPKLSWVLRVSPLEGQDLSSLAVLSLFLLSFPDNKLMCQSTLSQRR